MGKLRSTLGFVALILAALPAQADVASEAGFFDALARRAYQAGRYEQALESFQLVHEIAPSHRMLYNIALCSDLAGRSDMAFSLYQEYLTSNDPDAARRGQAARRLDDLKHDLALVEIETDPTQAAIYLDRKELGRFGVTPATIAVSAGEHRVLIERPDFAPREAAVAAKRGSTASVSVSLEPWFGAVTVHTAPSSAELRFLRDGVAVTVHPERGHYRLAAGQYQVVAAAPGYAGAETQFRVRKGDEARLDIALVPLPHQSGRLLVSTGKIAADVSIDGQRVAVTPATLSELGPGEHTLEVRAGKRAASRKVTIRAGHAVHVAIDLAGGAR